VIDDSKVRPQEQQNVHSYVEEEEPNHQVAEVVDNYDTLGAGGKRQEAGEYQENGAFIKDLDRIVLGIGEGPDMEQVAKLEKTHQDLCHELDPNQRAPVNYGKRKD